MQDGTEDCSAARAGIIYRRESDLDIAAFRAVLIESGLGATRPVDDTDRLGRMLASAGLVVTARRDSADGALLGVARCLSDFSWCCYVCELAVARSAQSLGIGTGLLAEIRRQLGPCVSVILASVPEAVGFYEHIGMPRLRDAFCYRRDC